jgi:hypothetical protein
LWLMPHEPQLLWSALADCPPEPPCCPSEEDTLRGGVGPSPLVLVRTLCATLTNFAAALSVPITGRPAAAPGTIGCPGGSSVCPAAAKGHRISRPALDCGRISPVDRYGHPPPAARDKALQRPEFWASAGAPDSTPHHRFAFPTSQVFQERRCSSRSS